MNVKEEEYAINGNNQETPKEDTADERGDSGIDVDIFKKEVLYCEEHFTHLMMTIIMPNSETIICVQRTLKFNMIFSVPARQPFQAVARLLHSLWEEGGPPPPVTLASRRVGTYIYSYLDTTH